MSCGLDVEPEVAFRGGREQKLKHQTNSYQLPPHTINSIITMKRIIQAATAIVVMIASSAQAALCDVNLAQKMAA